MDPTDLPIRSMIYYIPGGGEIMLTLPSVILSYLSPEDQQYDRYRQINSIIGTRQALLTFMKDIPDFPGLSASYPGIRSETLLIHGEQDKVIPISAAKRIIPVIPSCRAIFLKNVGHWVIGEDRKRVVDELSAFLY
jgi:pimeloyl-ACP methyl ester carboxylesterase